MWDFVINKVSFYSYCACTPFTATPTDPLAEMHLQPEPLFSLPTDNVGMLDIQGTPEGRIFLGGKDGYLYEVVYQAEDGWFSRKCKKINHSVSMLSFLVPSFLSLSEEGVYYSFILHVYIACDINCVFIEIHSCTCKQGAILLCFLSVHVNCPCRSPDTAFG